MIGSDDAALEQTPKALDVVCVDFTAHIFTSGVSDRLTRIAEHSQPVIGKMLIGRHKVNFVIDGVADEAIQGCWHTVLSIVWQTTLPYG